MKKGIILVFIILLLTACTGGKGKDDNNIDNNGGSDTPQTVEKEFPYDKLYGYWVLTDGGEYCNIFQSATGDNLFEFGDFANFTTGRVEVQSVENTKDDVFFFKLKYIDMDNLLGDKDIDIADHEEGFISIDGELYAYIGDDFSDAKWTSDYFLAQGLAEKLQGYWNEDAANMFVYVGKDPDSGQLVLVPGLYDAEPGGTYTFTTAEKEGEVYTLEAYLISNTSSSRKFRFDLTNYANGKIKFEDKAMHYGGADFETAYDEYAKKFH